MKLDGKCWNSRLIKTLPVRGIIWYQFTLLSLFSVDLFLTFLSSYGEFLPQQGKMPHKHLLKKILLNTNPRIKCIKSNGMKILQLMKLHKPHFWLNTCSREWILSNYNRGRETLHSSNKIPVEVHEFCCCSRGATDVWVLIRRRDNLGVFVLQLFFRELFEVGGNATLLVSEYSHCDFDFEPRITWQLFIMLQFQCITNLQNMLRLIASLLLIYLEQICKYLLCSSYKLESSSHSINSLEIQGDELNETFPASSRLRFIHEELLRRKGFAIAGFMAFVPSSLLTWFFVFRRTQTHTLFCLAKHLMSLGRDLGCNFKCVKTYCKL